MIPRARPRLRIVVLALSGLFWGCSPASRGGAPDAVAPTPSLRMNPGPTNRLNEATFDILGLSAPTLDALRNAPPSADQWPQCFALTRDEPGATALTDAPGPPLQGSYQVVSSVVRFTPNTPLQGGVRYRAVVHPDRLPGASSSAPSTVTALFSLPDRPASP